MFDVSPTLSVQQNSDEMLAGYIAPVVILLFLVFLVIPILLILLIGVYISRKNLKKNLEDTIRDLEEQIQQIQHHTDSTDREGEHNREADTEEHAL